MLHLIRRRADLLRFGQAKLAPQSEKQLQGSRPTDPELNESIHFFIANWFTGQLTGGVNKQEISPY